MRIVTDPKFWDCECPGAPSEYIHPKSQKVCKKCGTRPENQPDSRVNEIVAALKQAKRCGRRS
jgi:hypothetical protein